VLCRMFAMDEGATSGSSTSHVTPSPPLSHKSNERSSPEQTGRHAAGSFNNSSSNLRNYRNGSFTAALGLFLRMCSHLCRLILSVEHFVGLTDNSTEMFIRLASGFCTKLGPRKSNEDRLIAITDLNAVMEQMEKVENPNLAGSLTSRGLTRVGTPSRDRETCGFFAVYDGHCGDQASTFLENELHRAIFKHPLFSSNLEAAITDCCINIDKAFLVRTCRCAFLILGFLNAAPS
jgi:hypothetical protein